MSYEKEKSRIRAVQMDNLRGLLGIRRIYRVPNACIREFCGVMKVFSSGSAMWIGLLRESMKESV